MNSADSANRRSFGFILDHPRRDLPGAVTFAHALAKRGCDAYIIPFYDQASDVPLLPLDALVVNFARPANLELTRAYAASGLPVYILDTEGGIITEAGTNTPTRLASLLKDRGFHEILAGYFFWGPRLREAFVGRSGLRDEDLIVTGCPRFDYTSRPLRPALEFPESGFVLMNASYPLVNPLFSGSAAGERAAAVDAGWDQEYLAALTNDVAGAFEAFKQTTSRLARDLPNTRFLVRPHPFENHATYEREFRGLPNVTVNGAGSVLNAIAHASCLVHLNCSTAVEAIMLDRLPISLEYLNTPRMLGHAPLPSRISEPADSYEALVERVSNPEAFARNFPFASRHRESIHPWFYENDGSAAERVADALVARTAPRANPVSVARSLAASRSRSSTGQRLKALAGNAVGSFATSRLLARAQPLRREKLYSAAQIASDLQRLCAVTGTKMPSVAQARHPLTGLPLATVVSRAKGDQ